VAFEKIKCWKGRTVHFTFDRDSNKTMQVTLRTVGNSRAEAERICRLCYLQFEQGRSKDEVVEFRNRLLLKLGHRVPPHAQNRKRKAEEVSAEVEEEERCRGPVALAAVTAVAPEAVPVIVPAAVQEVASETTGSAPAQGGDTHSRARSIDGQDVLFEYTPRGGTAAVVFRTSARSCGNSLVEAERISNLCYQKFEEGSTEQEVLYYRNCLLSGCSFLMPSRHRFNSKSLAEATASAKPLAVTDGLVKSVAKRLVLKGVAEGSALVGEAPRGPAPAAARFTRKRKRVLDPRADAPKGHVAYSRVRANKACGTVIAFKFDTPQGKVNFQTTVKACGGSVTEALRICRLCYLKFEEGCKKEDVLRFRNQLYEQRGFKVPSLALAATRRNKQRTRAESTSLTLPEDAPEGNLAHRRCRTSTDGKTVSFEHVFAPGAPYVVFQTTTNKCSGSLKEAQRLCRLCFTKFEAGWSKDEVLRFRNHEYRKCGIRRLWKGSGMFYRSGSFHRHAQRADRAPATPRDPPSRSEPGNNEETPAKEAAKPKRVSSEAQLEKLRPCEPSGCALALPWPALHGSEAAAEVERAYERRDGLKGLVHQLRSTDCCGQTALDRRFCQGRRATGRKPAAVANALVLPGLDGTREILLELEHGMSPITGLVLNELLPRGGEDLVCADVLATQAPEITEVWRDLCVDEVR